MRKVGDNHLSVAGFLLPGVIHETGGNLNRIHMLSELAQASQLARASEDVSAGRVAECLAQIQSESSENSVSAVKPLLAYLQNQTSRNGVIAGDKLDICLRIIRSSGRFWGLNLKVEEPPPDERTLAADLLLFLIDILLRLITGHQVVEPIFVRFSTSGGTSVAEARFLCSDTLFDELKNGITQSSIRSMSRLPDGEGVRIKIRP